MVIRTENIEELEAVERVAAETVVCRRFEVVDTLGRVRIEAGVSGAGSDARPYWKLRDADGNEQASMAVDSNGDGGEIVSLYLSGPAGEHAQIQAGGLAGPSVSVERERGSYVELLAPAGAGLFVVRRGDAETVVQTIPGTRPEAFTHAGADDDDPKVSR